MYKKRKRLALLAVTCLLLEKQRRKKRRSCWTRPWIARRLQLGFYETLIKELVAEDTAEFRTMFRMDKAAFDRLLNMLLPLIEKVDTTMRASAKARLLVTLRYLATSKARHKTLDDIACSFYIHQQGLKTVFCVQLDECGWQQDERKWNGHAVRYSLNKP